MTLDLINQSVLDWVDDREWVASAALQTATTSNNVDLVLKAVQVGRQAVEQAVQTMDDLNQLVEDRDVEGVRELCSLDESVRKLCLIDKNLVEIGDKTKTWQQHWSARNAQHEAERDRSRPRAGLSDPFAANASTSTDAAVAQDEPDDESTDASTLSLKAFLAQPLSAVALELAASAEVDLLCALCKRHARALWPLRTELVTAVPEWQDPRAFSFLITGPQGDQEAMWKADPWRPDVDFIELVFSAGDEEQDRRTLQELSSFYRERVEHIASLGLVSIALLFVQLCTSLDVPGLEDLGEELSLLNRLAYDRPMTDSTMLQAPSLPALPLIKDGNFTLDDWRKLAPADVLRAYLDGWTPSDLPSSIRRLALPYLSVLEARAERSGSPDSNLATRLLYEYILTLPSARPPRLDSLLAIFEASKPTLPATSRIIKVDEELARLALACVYGCRDNSADAIVTMSKIFECLPVFDDKSTLSDMPNRKTLFTLHPPGSDLPTPQYLYRELQSFSTARLSISLDALDLHLAEAETFSRYSVAVPLSWFLASHNDIKAQRAWATRMARTSSTGGGGRAGDEGVFEGEDEWEMLMEDMVSLTEVGDVDELRKAFWMLDKQEALRIYFGGLLAASRISLAKALLHPSSGESPLSPQTIEELVIAASREFYDNAESGNIKEGNMKLAYECLAAAPQTPEIRKERDFIEATSRLCSYKLQSYSRADLTPIEIRLSKDRLAFVGRLLASNEDAYRHPDVILDLVSKLGYKGDKLAEIRTFAMISDSSLQAGDFEKTAEICDRMVSAVEVLRREQEGQDKENESIGTKASSNKYDIVQEASEVAWRNCFQLGKHEGFEDWDRRIKALGQALILCPGDRMSQLLPVWTKLEQDIADRTKARAEAAKQKPAGMLAGLGAPFSFGGGASQPGPAVESSNNSTPPLGSTAATVMQDSMPPSKGEKPGVATRTINAFFGSGGLRHGSPRRSGQSPVRPQSATSDQFGGAGSDQEMTMPGSPGRPQSGMSNHSNHSSSNNAATANKRDRTSDDFGRLFGDVGGHRALNQQPQQHQQQHRERGGEGFRAGLSSRLTKGVGWLIGAEEELERQERERDDML
ncbi:hypothetical protein OIO90_000743 [Microbotryomycetes sp. JL221]|nr:hypothetical protein OIO90_000743 [Microbotryomycetes sp. JL221]